MRNRRVHQQKYRAAERELMQVLSSIPRKKNLGSNVADCPSPMELRQFAAGKCDSSQRDELLTHLAACDLCINSMAGLRQRRWMIRMAVAIASAMVVITTATWLWVNQRRALPDLNRVATVDLRLISPTRGQVAGPRTATVRRAAGGVRIVLPVGSEGNYEMEILGEDARPTFVRSSGSTRLEGQDVVLSLSVDLLTLKSGKYLLALRRNSSEWAYYSVMLE
jgi:hypothetical protein